MRQTGPRSGQVQRIVSAVLTGKFEPGWTLMLNPRPEMGYDSSSRRSTAGRSACSGAAESLGAGRSRSLPNSRRLGLALLEAPIASKAHRLPIAPVRPQAAQRHWEESSYDYGLRAVQKVPEELKNRSLDFVGLNLKSW